MVQTHPRHGIHQGSVSQQAANHLHLSRPGGHVESCLTTLTCKELYIQTLKCWANPKLSREQTATHNVADIWRSPVLQQQQDNVEVPHESCYMDGSQSRLNPGGLKDRREGQSSNVQIAKRVSACFSECWKLTSVIAWMEAPYLTRSSITFTRFFLQAMWRGVKPFWHRKQETS